MAKVEIKGPIIPDGHQDIYDYFGIPATSPAKVNGILSLAAKGEDVEVIINSGGGSVFAGSEIYTSLKAHSGTVTAKVVGLAASAASFIAMGADRLEMSPTASIMIHRASIVAAGNKNDFEKTSEILSGIDESIANAYQLKTGISSEALLDMMSAETWLNALKAKEIGFIDGVMFEGEQAATNALTNTDGTLPTAVIDKMTMELAGSKTPPPAPGAAPDNALSLARARASATRELSKNI